MTSPEPDRGADGRGHRRRQVLYAGLAVAVIGIVVVLVWFQPQTLLFDTVVEEDFPSMPDAAEASDGAADDDNAPDGDEGDEDVSGQETPVATGSFASRSRYTVKGTTAVYELEDGSRVLRLEDFESTNGPDLFVYLTAADEADSDEALNADFVNLGRLKGNVGNQNYEIPADVDLGTYDTVVIWCQRFTVGFGAADLKTG